MQSGGVKVPTGGRKGKGCSTQHCATWSGPGFQNLGKRADIGIRDEPEFEQLRTRIAGLGRVGGVGSDVNVLWLAMLRLSLVGKRTKGGSIA